MRPGAGGEAGPVERDDAPVAFGQVDDLKHARDSFVAEDDTGRRPSAPRNEIAPGGCRRRSERREFEPSRGGDASGHWAVMVPFMSGWTSHMKV